MPERIGWTRDQQLIALRLYMRTAFGRLHGRNPEIIDLAHRIGRTPNALAMKACNFASLDPEFRATGRKALSGASESDRALWSEFSGDSERVAAEAEEAFARLDPAQAARDEADLRIPTGETDVARIIRARRVQSFFRAAVITSYDSRCAITGLAVPELLVASHIIPWSQNVARRADPTNALRPTRYLTMRSIARPWTPLRIEGAAIGYTSGRVRRSIPSVKIPGSGGKRCPEHQLVGKR